MIAEFLKDVYKLNEIPSVIAALGEYLIKLLKNGSEEEVN